LNINLTVALPPMIAGLDQSRQHRPAQNFCHKSIAGITFNEDWLFDARKRLEISQPLNQRRRDAIAANHNQHAIAGRGMPADWISDPGITPPSAYFGFVHTNDPLILCAEEIPAWRDYGLAPFGGSHMVTTGPTLTARG
jgi:hypothetical protein